MVESVAEKPDLAESRREQIETHHRLALQYAERLRTFDLRSETYQPPPTDDVRDWCPVLQWSAYYAKHAYHADVCTALEMGRGPFYCAMCQPLRDRPKGYKLMPCWPCWWETYAYDNAIVRGRAMSKHAVSPPALRPTEV